MTKRREAPEIAVGLGLLVMLVVFHFVLLANAGALWRDEANSARFALLPTLGDSFEALRYDSLPLGGTVALRAWASFTTTDQGFRVFGLLVGVAILAALVGSSRLLGVRVPLLSLALFGMSPMVLRYGDSVRPYGLGALFVVTTVGLVRKLARDGDGWVKVAAPVSAILAVQCLYQNAFLVLGICAGGLAIALRRKDPARAAFVLGTGVLAALSLIPYLGRIRAAGEWSAVVKQPTSPGAFASIVADALGSSGGLFVWIWTAVLLGGLALVVLDLAWKGTGWMEGDRDTLLFCGVALTVSILGFVGFVLVLELNTQPWYLLPLLALAALCLDAIHGIAWRRPKERIVRTAGAAVLALAAVPAVWSAVHVRFTNVDTVASKLGTVARQGDIIVVSPWYFGVSFQRAYPGGVAWTTLPPMRDLTIHRYDLLKEAMATADPLRPMTEAVRSALRSGKRVFVVGALTLPAEGERLRPLPPATTPDLELRSGEYLNEWMLELGSVLREHALDGRIVKVEEWGPVSPLETLPIFVFEGYRP